MRHQRELLYHGTGAYALAAIIAEDCLREGTHWGKPGEPHGPRMTRDYVTACSFISYAMHWGEGGVIVLDRNAVIGDYRIKTYCDASYDGKPFGDEQEEVILTRAIKPLSKYLVSIVIDRRALEIAREPEMIAAAKTECGWAFSDAPAGMRRALRALAALEEHPFLNRWRPRGTSLPWRGNWDRKRGGFARGAQLGQAA